MVNVGWVVFVCFVVVVFVRVVCLFCFFVVFCCCFCVGCLFGFYFLFKCDPSIILKRSCRRRRSVYDKEAEWLTGMSVSTGHVYCLLVDSCVLLKIVDLARSN